MDVLMPRLDGRETLRRMRQAGNLTPVILLTQVGEATERAMALEEGADDYLNKPLEGRASRTRGTHPCCVTALANGASPIATAWVLVSGELRLDRVCGEQRWATRNSPARRKACSCSNTS